MADHAVVVLIPHVSLALFAATLGSKSLPIQIRPLLRRVHRSVRRIGAEIGQKRFPFVRIFLDELLRVFKEDIRAMPFCRHWNTVVPVRAIKISIVPVVRGLPHSASAMAEHVLKAPVFRPIRIIVAKVPLPKHPRGIPGIAKDIPDRHFVLPQHRPAHNGVPDAGSIRPVPRNQGGAGGRAGRRDVIIVQPDRLAVQFVEVRCLNDRVAMCCNVPIALIICNHEDHIGFFLGDRRAHEGKSEAKHVKQSSLIHW
jgi:hypothetical protein